jgi:hypothetical protein
MKQILGIEVANTDVRGESSVLLCKFFIYINFDIINQIINNNFIKGHF